MRSRALISPDADQPAHLAKAQQHSPRATRLYAAAATLRHSLGALLSPTDRQEVDRHLAELRATLGDADFEAARAAGQAMPLEQAIAYARADTEQESRRCPTQ